MNPAYTRLIAFWFAALVAGACGGAVRDSFVIASSADTVVAYKQFMQEHPDSKHTAYCKQRIRELENDKEIRESGLQAPEKKDEREAEPAVSEAERTAFEQAKAEGTGTAIARFLEGYPRSSLAPEARELLFPKGVQLFAGEPRPRTEIAVLNVKQEDIRLLAVSKEGGDAIPGVRPIVLAGEDKLLLLPGRYQLRLSLLATPRFSREPIPDKPPAMLSGEGELELTAGEDGRFHSQGLIPLVLSGSRKKTPQSSDESLMLLISVEPDHTYSLQVWTNSVSLDLGGMVPDELWMTLDDDATGQRSGLALPVE